MLFVACQKDLPNDGIPSYLNITDVAVETNEATEGANTHNISNVRIDAGGDNLGANKYPTTIPVLNSGTINFIFTPLIKVNGISAVRDPYPFYSTHAVSLEMVEREVTAVVPTFTYRTGVIFGLLEHFSTGTFFDNLQIEDGKGKIFTTDNSVRSATNNGTVIPDGGPVFVELDYKNNVAMQFGVDGEFNNGSIFREDKLVITPSDTWKKIYIDISGEVALMQADRYNFFFEALRPDTIPEIQIEVDNFKVLHF